MFVKPETIDLLRYLIVLRVNQPLVALPPCLSVEMSYVLGTLITERLPTAQVKQWRRTQTAWEEANPLEKSRKRPSKSRWPLTPPELVWPLAMAWLPYPAKQTYGEGETILCELKLFGESASHELFLELILPTLETAGVQPDGRWKRSRSLWGRYSVQAVYAARGKRWEPLVMDGRLDFNYRPSPNQWAEGLALGAELGFSADQLDWFTPYQPLTLKRPSRGKATPATLAKYNAPTLPELIQALIARLDVVSPGWISGEERETAVDELLTLTAAAGGGMKSKGVQASPNHWPGLVWGRQTFDPIAPALLPYLELASILHIGNQTHYGCGTFRLS
jgi:hypothetical protein